MTEAKTNVRIDWPTVLVIGAVSPPAYVDALKMDGYKLEAVRTAEGARESIPPHAARHPDVAGGPDA